jgi:hypothetical protein
MVSRRNLLTFTVSAAAVWFGRQAPSGASECAGETSEYGALAAYCSALHCPEAIADACQRALSASEASPDHLARLILADSSTTRCGDCTSVAALRRLVGERSQDDFDRGRIVYVDGWMLSLTETRLYALSASLAQKHSQSSNQT